VNRRTARSRTSSGPVAGSGITDTSPLRELRYCTVHVISYVVLTQRHAKAPAGTYQRSSPRF
jgi:hypothetical protein